MLPKSWFNSHHEQILKHISHQDVNKKRTIETEFGKQKEI